MFMPRDDPEIDRLYTSGELKKKKEQEKRVAQKDAFNALKHWVDFFANSPKYIKVGQVKRPAGWKMEDLGDIPPLCKKADEGRPKRAAPAGKS